MPQGHHLSLIEVEYTSPEGLKFPGIERAIGVKFCGFVDAN